MFYMNKVYFLGRAVKAAELKSVGESKVAVFRLVSNRRIKKRNGEYDERATYIDVECWNQRAEYASSYIKKGTPVLITGQLETDEWTSKDGQKRSKLKIYASEVQAERPRDESSTSDGADSADGAYAKTPVGATVSGGGDGSSASNDLPF